MRDFLLLLAGGAIGVLCDRLWQKVEKRTRLKINGGFFTGVDGEGVSFTITNVGKESLPPIRLCVFAPEIGSVYIFPASHAENARDNLWPGQEREFQCSVRANPDPRLGPGPMLNVVAKMVDNPHVVFRVQPVDGDTIFFSSHRIGKALARLFAAHVNGPGIGHIGGGIWADLHFERRGPIEWIRHRLYLRSIVKQAKASQGKADVS